MILGHVQNYIYRASSVSCCSLLFFLFIVGIMIKRSYSAVQLSCFQTKGIKSMWCWKECLDTTIVVTSSYAVWVPTQNCNWQFQCYINYSTKLSSLTLLLERDLVALPSCAFCSISQLIFYFLMYILYFMVTNSQQNFLYIQVHRVDWTVMVVGVLARDTRPKGENWHWIHTWLLYDCAQ